MTMSAKLAIALPIVIVVALILKLFMGPGSDPVRPQTEEDGMIRQRPVANTDGPDIDAP